MKKYRLKRGTLTAKIRNTHRTRFHRHSETCDVTMQRTNKKLKTDVVKNIRLKLLFQSCFT